MGLWTGSALLLSSQALSCLIVCALWSLDVLGRLILGRHVIGGTEYMFDAHLALGLRQLSLFHVLLPIVLLRCLRLLGYDRRALGLQSAIAGLGLLAGRLAGPKRNINFAFIDPIFHRSLGAAPIHLAVSFVALVVIVYSPSHLLLKRLFPR